MASNLFSNIPDQLPEEVFEDILVSSNLRIERILSEGHRSEPEDWYDQAESEWVLVLQGFSVIEYQDGSEVRLNAGDYLNIPAHVKHRVKTTSPKQQTIWLAIFYS